MLFTKQKKLLQLRLGIKYQEVSFKTEYKYLKVVFQKNRNYNKHVKFITEKRVKQMNILQFLKVQLGVLLNTRSSSSFEGFPLQVRHKQDWGRGFILLLPQTAALPESDAGSGVIKPASSFVIQNRQTSCSM